MKKLSAVLVAVSLSPLFAPMARAAEPEPLAWPEEQQRFWLEGPVWLLSDDAKDRLAAADSDDRAEAMARLLDRDPLPETETNEMREGIRRRRALVTSELLSFHDERAKLLFLHGPPDERRPVDCLETFKPLELWRYGETTLLLFRPAPESPYRLWLPLESKRALYTREMAFWLEEWEEVGRFVSGPRIDRRLCDDAKLVDEITGVDSLREIDKKRRGDTELLAWLEAPSDLVAWAREASATEIPESTSLAIDRVWVSFPGERGQRILTRSHIVLPSGGPVQPYLDEATDTRRVRLSVEGVVEDEETLFDEFRLRFELPPEENEPLVLAVDELLRKGRRFRIRVRVIDEVGGAEAIHAWTVEVPEEPDPGLGPDSVAAVGSGFGAGDGVEERSDSLVLLVPPTEVLFGRVRVHAAVRGEGIDRVAFLVDAERQLTRTAPPFTADLVLPTLPREVVVRAEGHDEEGALVAADEVVLNQPRGRLAVEILEPSRGVRIRGAFTTRVQVVVPEGRRVERVLFQINDETVAEIDAPQWMAELEIPPPRPDEVVFLTAVAELDDGSRAEDVRFLATPYAMGELDVELVELYTTVLGGRGRLVRDLDREDFRVFEDGRPQEIVELELVEDLPLTVGIAIDTSGSMASSLVTAQRTAVEFLDSVVTPRDQCFAVGFASEPGLLMHRTPDVAAVEEALEELRADGWTALHDAVVFSLYYFRGVSGRRVLVLLSDGDDTDSRLEFEEALRYARQSGTVIYTIGLKNDALNLQARRKLGRLAAETGGRSFLISRAEELRGVYREIEAELRSQYLLAYAPDRPASEGGYREVEVEMVPRGLEARTIRGYVP